MSGTSPTATFAPTNFTVDTATVYKTKIDSNSIVMQRIVDCFAPRQTTIPAMTVTLDAGFVFKGTTLTEMAAQTTGTITAPVGNPRIDRVVVDRFTGALTVVTGTPASSPAAPAIPSGKVPVCQVLLQTTSSTITNAMLTDERALYALGRGLAGEEGIGQWLQDDGAGNLTLKTNATLRDNGSGLVTTGLTTEATITAVATTDLGTMASNIGVINGNTGITSFGNSASTANPFYVMRVTGTPLLTNSTNLILPGAANYQCAAGDWLFCKFEGSSKWRVSILPASGQAVVSPTNATSSSFGLVKPDNTTITIVAGVISASTPKQGSAITLNPYATAASGTLAHGLGATPNDVIAYLECVTTEAGYAVGERVPMGGANCSWQGAGITISFDATNINYYTNTSDLPDIVNKSGSGRQSITAANWKVVMKPLLWP